MLSQCTVYHFPIGFTNQTGEGLMNISSIPCYGPIKSWKYTCRTDKTRLSCDKLMHEGTCNRKSQSQGYSPRDWMQAGKLALTNASENLAGRVENRPGQVEFCIGYKRLPSSGECQKNLVSQSGMYCSLLPSIWCKNLYNEAFDSVVMLTQHKHVLQKLKLYHAMPEARQNWADAMHDASFNKYVIVYLLGKDKAAWRSMSRL